MKYIEAARPSEIENTLDTNATEGADDAEVADLTDSDGAENPEDVTEESVSLDEWHEKQKLIPFVESPTFENDKEKKQFHKDMSKALDLLSKLLENGFIELDTSEYHDELYKELLEETIALNSGLTNSENTESSDLTEEFEKKASKWDEMLDADLNNADREEKPIILDEELQNLNEEDRLLRIAQNYETLTMPLFEKSINEHMDVVPKKTRGVDDKYYDNLYRLAAAGLFTSTIAGLIGTAAVSTLGLERHLSLRDVTLLAGVLFETVTLGSYIIATKLSYKHEFGKYSEEYEHLKEIAPGFVVEGEQAQESEFSKIDEEFEESFEPHTIKVLDILVEAPSVRDEHIEGLCKDLPREYKTEVASGFQALLSELDSLKDTPGSDSIKLVFDDGANKSPEDIENQTTDEKKDNYRKIKEDMLTHLAKIEEIYDDTAPVDQIPQIIANARILTEGEKPKKNGMTRRTFLKIGAVSGVAGLGAVAAYKLGVGGIKNKVEATTSRPQVSGEAEFQSLTGADGEFLDNNLPRATYDHFIERLGISEDLITLGYWKEIIKSVSKQANLFYFEYSIAHPGVSYSDYFKDSFMPYLCETLSESETNPITLLALYKIGGDNIGNLDGQKEDVNVSAVQLTSYKLGEYFDRVFGRNSRELTKLLLTGEIGDYNSARLSGPVTIGINDFELTKMGKALESDQGVLPILFKKKYPFIPVVLERVEQARVKYEEEKRALLEAVDSYVALSGNDEKGLMKRWDFNPQTYDEIGMGWRPDPTNMTGYSIAWMELVKLNEVEHYDQDLILHEAALRAKEKHHKAVEESPNPEDGYRLLVMDQLENSKFRKYLEEHEADEFIGPLNEVLMRYEQLVKAGKKKRESEFHAYPHVGKYEYDPAFQMMLGTMSLSHLEEETTALVNSHRKVGKDRFIPRNANTRDAIEEQIFYTVALREIAPLPLLSMGENEPLKLSHYEAPYNYRDTIATFETLREKLREFQYLEETSSFREFFDYLIVFRNGEEAFHLTKGEIEEIRPLLDKLDLGFYSALHRAFDASASYAFF